ncbi:sulfotransferase family protein [Rubrivirga sp.]|uniref:sulfotransferase family protein n=1 Tax=Rubrivirga sp. TaxID=1885344 RepID=UPI003C77CB1B
MLSDFPPPGAMPIGLIGGTGRSGTTALRDALALHPDVLAFPELRFSIDPDGLTDVYRAFRDGWSPYHADVALRRLRALLEAVAQDSPSALPGRVARKLGLDEKAGRQAVPAYHGHRALEVCPTFLERAEQLLADLEGYRYVGAWTGTPGGARAEVRVGGPYERDDLASMLGGFWRAVAADSLEVAGRSYFLDKQTWSILWAEDIFDLLPTARLVHVVRDPRDVAASTATMRWGPSDPLLAARWTADLLGRWAEIQPRLPADRVLEVRLEDLADGGLRRVVDFLGLEWSAVLEGASLSRTREGRWKRDLGNQSGAVAERLAPFVERYGYEPA